MSNNGHGKFTTKDAQEYIRAASSNFNPVAAVDYTDRIINGLVRDIADYWQKSRTTEAEADALHNALVNGNEMIELQEQADWLGERRTDSESHVIGLGVDFDVLAMGEHARVYTGAIKSRMYVRMEETKAKNKAGDKLARASIIKS